MRSGGMAQLLSEADLKVHTLQARTAANLRFCAPYPYPYPYPYL